MKTFKPMLAAQLPPKLTFPYLASPKLDGIRCVLKDNMALSRTLKPIPNRRTQHVLSHMKLDGLDGELIVGSPQATDCFRNTSSAIMTHENQPDFTFYVFDDFTNPLAAFKERLDFAAEKVNKFGAHIVKLVPHAVIENQAQFDSAEEHFLSLGYEGMMCRSFDGTYKYGRATIKENSLFKVKRYIDAEAIVIGFVELMHNDNEQQLNALGYNRRSSHQQNQRSGNTLGALIAKDILTGIEFNVGTGFDAAERANIWRNKSNYLNKQFTYKSFKIGVKDKPRHGVFKWWRKEGF